MSNSHNWFSSWNQHTLSLHFSSVRISSGCIQPWRFASLPSRFSSWPGFVLERGSKWLWKVSWRYRGWPDGSEYIPGSVHADTCHLACIISLQINLPRFSTHHGVDEVGGWVDKRYYADYTGFFRNLRDARDEGRVWMFTRKMLVSRISLTYSVCVNIKTITKGVPPD